MRTLRVSFLIFIIALTVYADGPFCMQNGNGPKDMMMSNGEMNPKYMWGKKGGSVKLPIILDDHYTHHERKVIFGGLSELASKTCVKFYVYEHENEAPPDYVFISKTKSRGCWSYVGKQGGPQDISLPIGCINHRTIMHEMMHALGFSHEHVRGDRDNYVIIMWKNIQMGRERNFVKRPDSKSDQFGPYDYESIMHYDNKAFSKNGRETIRPIKGSPLIGRIKQMSRWDSKKINRAYKCYGKGGGLSYHPSAAPHSSGFGFGNSPSPFNSPVKNFPSFPESFPFSNSNGPPAAPVLRPGSLGGPPHPNDVESDDHRMMEYSRFPPSSSSPFYDDHSVQGYHIKYKPGYNYRG